MVEVSYKALTTKGRLQRQILTEQEIVSLAQKFGTPFYIIDEATLRTKVSELENGFHEFSGPLRVAYSVKSNFNPEILKIFVDENILFDLTSQEELYFLLKCGGDPKNVIYTSMSETETEYSNILGRGVSKIVISSFNGLNNLLAASAKRGSRVKSSNINTINSNGDNKEDPAEQNMDDVPGVLIRVNPEVGVKAEVRASYRHGKFGVPFNGGTVDSATNIIKRILKPEKALKFEGFHFHLGSQIADPTCFINALEKLENFILRTRREFPELDVRFIDIGGGTPVFYGSNPVPTPQEIGHLVTTKLNELAEVLGSKFTVIVESGRYLSAESCLLVSKIVNKKCYEDNEFIVVDAGYHLLLDAALLRQEYPQQIIPSLLSQQHQSSNRGPSSQQPRKTNLVGRLCDTDDVFPISNSSDLEGAEVGKYVVFQNVGAYSVVFNMPFHCQPKPPIFIKRQKTGEFELARKGQTVEQLFLEESV
jgi:diaminopimelate decarboxylase